MSIHAGSLLHVAGRNVIDRLQSAGLGDVRIPIETIREVGNREVVDKVPGEPDFTFTMESLDVGTDLMALLTGKVGEGTGSGQAPGASDPEGTEYDWLDCKTINILSPWKDADTGSGGVIEAGHLIPGYYPTRMTQRYGVTDNATFSVELGGGSFYYAKGVPEEDYFEGDGGTTDFQTAEPTIHHRKGGAEGTTFRDVFGVMVDGQVQTEGVDYEVSGGDGEKAKVEFTKAPAEGADVRVAYFSSEEHAFPQSVHASAVVKPAAVRGRNILIEIEDARVRGGQSFELEATVEGEVERELGEEDPTGRSNTGTDANGSFTVRARDVAAFFELLNQITGVAEDEVYGWFNNNTVKLAVKIQNPRNPGEIIKTILVTDAKFQPPGTPARVNQPTDFAMRWESATGTFKEVKGEPS